MAILGPLELEPQASRRLWGGSALRRWLPGLAPEGGEPVGEAWLVYAENRVRNGPYAGRTLQQVADELGAALLGTRSAARYGEKVPLLSKLIDAAQPLSVQVHPDDAYAQSVEAESGHLGKSEAWYVLSAEPGAEVVWGFARAVRREEVREAARAGALERLLRKVPVAAGEVIYTPAGTVHALGAGLLIYEIQQSSDLTYRLYDYGRTDASGQPRELHLDKALEVARLSPGGEPKRRPRQLSETVTELVWAPHFALERWTLSGAAAGATDPATLELWTLLGGAAALEAGAERLNLGPAGSLVLPAGLGRYRWVGEGTLLRSYLPAVG